ncbi:AI-2E family transporter [Halogeometricum sp. CBA1124]|uniref:AI-2E family transporter n=1 Tax=Halogeometricum sp. CBA1124 TaxID=2668071 RepID=UPI00142D0642|nr:AI-2E family transporter [Halogeometricum sp. CBA1124]MUV57452.1 AI-2E family transporter [Halogeometricum sp. CBA1124]
MWSLSSSSSVERSRLGWWAYVLGLGLVLAFVVYSFVGTFVLGVFAYYAARPLYDRISRVTDSDGITAAATMLGFVLPVLALLVYAGVHTATSLQATLGSVPPPVQSLVTRFTGVQSMPQAQWETLSTLVTNPPQSLSLNQQSITSLVGRAASVLGTVLNGLLHLTLALAMGFYLLRDDDSIAAWFHSNVAERDSPTGQYAAAVDDDLESLYFGNVLFVATMAVIAAAVYLGTNAVAPSGLSVPMPLVLAVLSGGVEPHPPRREQTRLRPHHGVPRRQRRGNVAEPLPVRRRVLRRLSRRLGPPPAGVIQPYVTGRQLHPGLLLFAYILGPVVWGWYGFFLLPLVVVLVIEVVRVTFTDLVHGDSLTPKVESAASLGSSEPEVAGDGGSDGGDDADAASDVAGDEGQ